MSEHVDSADAATMEAMRAYNTGLTWTDEGRVNAEALTDAELLDRLDMYYEGGAAAFITEAMEVAGP